MDETAAPLPPPVEFPPIHDILRRLGIRLDKQKSQHFLKHGEICVAIAELCGLTRGHTAIEVGMGLGNLTVELAARAGQVLAVEIDQSFSEWHEYVAAAYGPIEVVYEDFTRLDLEDLVRAKARFPALVGVGNLPYQITSEILFRFVDSPVPFERCVFMIQKEVAERIAAGPGARASGALSYKIALRFNASIAFHIGPEAFLPPPKVTSSVLVLERLATSPLRDDAHRKRLYTLLDGIFRFRRKTLLNGLLMSSQVASREASIAVLEKAGIDHMRRPENLSLEEVLRLEKALHDG